MDSQGGGRARGEDGRFKPDVPDIHKQIELDRVAARGAAGVARQTNRQRWHRRASTIDVMVGTEKLPRYPEHPEDRPKDIRLEPTEKQKAQLRAMKKKDKED